MAKHERTRKQRVALLPLLGTAVGVYAGYAAAQPFLSGKSEMEQVTIIMDQESQSFTGYSFVNQKFYPENMVRGYLPILLGIAGHKVFSWLKLNRYLPAGVAL